jgi:hypothetical protein
MINLQGSGGIAVCLGYSPCRSVEEVAALHCMLRRTMNQMILSL